MINSAAVPIVMANTAIEVMMLTPVILDLEKRNVTKETMNESIAVEIRNKIRKYKKTGFSGTKKISKSEVPPRKIANKNWLMLRSFL